MHKEFSDSRAALTTGLPGAAEFRATPSLFCATIQK